MDIQLLELGVREHFSLVKQISSRRKGCRDPGTLFKGERSIRSRSAPVNLHNFGLNAVIIAVTLASLVRDPSVSSFLEDNSVPKTWSYPS